MTTARQYDIVINALKKGKGLEDLRGESREAAAAVAALDRKIDGLRSATDPALRATKQLSDAQRTLFVAVASGRTTMSQATKTLGAYERQVMAARVANDNLTKSKSRFGAVAQGFGHQLQDVIVTTRDLESGIRAAGVQGAQFVSLLGPAGPLAGVGLALLAPIVAGFFRSAEATDAASEAARNYDADLAALNRTVLELTGNEAALADLRKGESLRQAVETVRSLYDAEFDGLRKVQDEERRLATLRERHAEAQRRQNIGGNTGITAGLATARGDDSPQARAIAEQIRQQELTLRTANTILERDRERLAVAKQNLEIIQQTEAARFGGAGGGAAGPANDNRFAANDNRQAELFNSAREGLRNVLGQGQSPYEQRLSQLEDFRAREQQQILAAVDFELINNDRKNELLLASDERYEQAKRALQLQTSRAAISMAQQATSGSLAALEELGAGSSAIYKGMFLANQTAALANAGINTAEGVTKALSSAPPPLNFALATAVGVAGGIQIAKIGAQTIQGFEKGGLVQGGRQLIQINERGQEFVMNAQATRRNLPALQAMNAGSSSGSGGVTTVYLGDAQAEAALGHLEGRLVMVERSVGGVRRSMRSRDRLARSNSNRAA